MISNRYAYATLLNYIFIFNLREITSHFYIFIFLIFVVILKFDLILRDSKIK